MSGHTDPAHTKTSLVRQRASRQEKSFVSQSNSLASGRISNGFSGSPGVLLALARWPATPNHPYRRAAIFLAVAATLALCPVARADDDCSAPWTTPTCYKHADEGFYNDPPPPATPGQIIRSEPSRLVLEPSGIIPGWLADGTRIMYSSGGPR